MKIKADDIEIYLESLDYGEVVDVLTLVTAEVLKRQDRENEQ